MTHFPAADLRQAYLFAAQGGQAVLQLRRLIRTPNAVRLIDSDYARLMATARHIGAFSARADRIGLPGQSILLDGKQADWAVAECRQLTFA